MIKVDFVLVGGGLAGCTLAHQLESIGKSFVWIDEPSLSACSSIAAGLINPFNFSSKLPLWNIEKVKPLYKNFYSKVEEKLNTKIYFEKTFVKKIDADEFSFYDNFIKTKELFNSFSFELSQSILKMNGAAYVDVNLFLQVSKEYFLEQNCLINEKFDHDSLQIESNQLVYKNYLADKIIFAEGWKVSENKFFEYLPMKSVKGEILHFKTSESIQDQIFYNSKYLIPFSQDRGVLGATYNHKYLDEITSEESKIELVDELKAFGIQDFLIEKHLAGIRPTALDRKMIIGKHPYFQNVFIMNGLGSKGCIYAPYLAEELVSFIFQNMKIDAKINVARFDHLYY